MLEGVDIVKRKVQGYTEEGYFKYISHIGTNDSVIVSMYRGDKNIKKLVITHYPLKYHTPFIILDSLENYKTITTLTNSMNKILNRLLNIKEGLTLIVDEDKKSLEFKDNDGNTIYLLNI